MRQAGVLAAAALIALEEMPKRLDEDHGNARFLAGALSQAPGIRVTHEVQTNIVIFDVSGAGFSTADFSARLKSGGVLINGINPNEMRLLTHYDVNRADCARALAAVEEVARSAAQTSASR